MKKMIFTLLLVLNFNLIKSSDSDSFKSDASQDMDGMGMFDDYANIDNRLLGKGLIGDSVVADMNGESSQSMGSDDVTLKGSGSTQVFKDEVKPQGSFDMAEISAADMGNNTLSHPVSSIGHDDQGDDHVSISDMFDDAGNELVDKATKEAVLRDRALKESDNLRSLMESMLANIDTDKVAPLNELIKKIDTLKESFKNGTMPDFIEALEGEEPVVFTGVDAFSRHLDMLRDRMSDLY